MNSHWANEYARQHIEDMRREAAGETVLRIARAEAGALDRTEPPLRRRMVRARLRTVVVRMVRPFAATMPTVRGMRRG